LAAKIYWPAVEAGFRHKRQTLVNALNKDLKIPKAKLIEAFEKVELPVLSRAQNLTFEHWQVLSKRIEKLVK
jgi:16S rRNA A1518/A1519 N6-dimethyltransferase RsmA/KsgA/DIM1 with predicted DNA glycosylase/AP lyase activity